MIPVAKSRVASPFARTRFTEEKIIGILNGVETDLKPAELCRKYGISEATYRN
ncbi:transposase [Burkholderia sp. A2]|uniref:transposase n=1 Tax=Burkholderia sp. A2 TaxID=236253 RepID=UPI00114CA9F7